ncbi:MAG: FlgO family outer membrane protein [Myxococcota bacterium]
MTLLALWTSLAWGAPSVAVTAFDDAADSAEFAALGKGLQSMLTTDLAQVASLTLVERARLDQVLAEQALGTDGVLDPATAAQIGKVLGATHLVTGSYTVVSGTMRLDARLVDVTTGQVVRAFDTSGPRDEFFDLEKQLVTALLEGLGTELSAKERAQTQRVHTLEFDLFLRFSDGLAARDRGALDEAQKTLAQISESDPGFQLARTTLEDIGKLRSAVQVKQKVALVAELESRLAARSEEARAEARVLSRLRAVGADPSAALEDRVSALYLVAVGTTRVDGQPFFTALDRSGDAFALQRASDEAFQGLWALLRDHPTWVPMKRRKLPGLKMPREASFDADLAAVRAVLFGPDGLGKCTFDDVLNGYELDHFWGSPREVAKLEFELGRDRGDACSSLAINARNGLDSWIAAGDRDAIVTALRDWGKATESSWALSLIDSRLEKISALPAPTPPEPTWLGGRSFSKRLHVAGLPVWTLGKGGGRVGTAEPTGPAEGEALVWESSDVPQAHLVVVGGGVLADGGIGAELEVSDGATVGLLIALTDVDTPPTCDAWTKGTTEAHPSHAFAAVVSNGVVRVGRFSEVPANVQCGRRDFGLTGWTLDETLAELPFKGSVRLVEDHGTLRVTSGKKSAEVGLEGPADGFTGLFFEGTGKVVVRGLTVGPP